MNDDYQLSHINVNNLEKELTKHPDRQFVKYLLDGIKNGFDTMVSKTELPTVECKNLQSAFRNPDSVDIIIKQEVDKGYLIGPFKSSLLIGIVSPIEFPLIFSDGSDKLYRLDALYRGIKKNEKKSTKPRLPITFTILKDICQFLRKGYYTPYVDILLEAACVTAYFGFLRCGEFTVLHSFDSECNVSIEDIRFLKDKVTFHLKASKTDPFREGVDIHLFASGASVCPVLFWNVTWNFVIENSKIVKHKTLFCDGK
ncbi:unnamed protein product [Mytilus coruscus]|uniref:Uncharacterized protein n=1 Tax=Mytilus coruscus TaxID=42192 RepID=A0A6J8E4M8_MYTCO|nr:unnamed protein product [Mytilus coruscus]